LNPFVSRLQQLNAQTPFTMDQPEYWVLDADQAFSAGGHRDIGLFSIYLLNLVHLKPGEAMYLPAGNLHAYLRGVGMEIMANSDNVLRGGLSPKNKDVPELLSVLTFDYGAAEILRPVKRSNTESVYLTNAPEFELSRIQVSQGLTHQSGVTRTAEAITSSVLDNSDVVVTTDALTLTLRAGESLFLPAGVGYTIRTDGTATLYRATAPLADQTENAIRSSNAAQQFAQAPSESGTTASSELGVRSSESVALPRTDSRRPMFAELLGALVGDFTGTQVKVREIEAVHQPIQQRIQDSRSDLWSPGRWTYTPSERSSILGLTEHLMRTGRLNRRVRFADLGGGEGYVGHLVQALSGADVTLIEQDAGLVAEGQRATESLPIS